MTATTPPPVANRIANYLPAPQPPLPATPDARQEAWADAVAAAARFYQNRLAHPNADAAERAARAIFDLEKTRLRHGRPLAGAEPPPPAPRLDPIEGYGEPTVAPTPQPEPSPTDDLPPRTPDSAFWQLVGKVQAVWKEEGQLCSEADAIEYALAYLRDLSPATAPAAPDPRGG